MKETKYKIRTIRLTEKTWEKLKDKRWKSKLGWEKFISNLIKDEKQ